MNIATVYDSTGVNLGKFTVPAGVTLAGYDTGSGGVAWTKVQYAAHPGSLHIDQDPGAGDFTADVLDSERGAVPIGSPLIADWYKRTLDNYLKGVRPGQRHPSVYQSASNVTANVNALIAGGVTSGPGLWVANWNLSDPQAVADVQGAAGPFPVIGVQWENRGPFDISVFSGAWLAAVSKAPAPTPSGPVPPFDQISWNWCLKCQGLFYGPHVPESICPAGGQHDGRESGNYSLRIISR